MTRALLLLVGLFVGGSQVFADSTVVFNEIMYHPPANEAEFEWVELHNQMAVDMDISNWSLQGSVAYKFAEGTVLVGGGYLVVAATPASLAGLVAQTNLYGPFTGSLSNAKNLLELRNNNQRLMDWVEYDVEGDWPTEPNGGGVSLAKLNPDFGSSAPRSWAGSARVGGTPSAENFPTPQPVIVSSKPVGLNGSWKYDASGAEVGSAWREPGFDDAAWASGAALFQAGNGRVAIGQVRAISTLFNSGLNASGTPVSSGGTDPHYRVILSAQTITPPPPTGARVIDNHPAWLANDSTSKWLGPVNPGTVDVAAGNYYFLTTFDLTGFVPTTAQIILNVAADNDVDDVLLNGVSLGVNYSGFNALSPDMVVVNGFVEGTNTLEFHTSNAGSSPNPGGFRVQAKGTAVSVDSTIPTLFSTGLGADGKLLAAGAADPHFVLTASAQSNPPPPPIAATAVQRVSTWFTNNAKSGWLGPVNPATNGAAPGNYVYETTFDLTGFDPASARVTAQVAVDDTLTDVLINGVSTGITYSFSNALSAAFVVTSGFVAGLNRLEFRTANRGALPNPTGFRSQLSGTAVAVLPTTTTLPLGPITYRFRTKFFLDADPAATALQLLPLADDGAVFYLNGVEVSRINMPSGSINASTPASANVADIVLGGAFGIPSDALVRGDNFLAVEVHQASDGLNDMVFGAELSAATTVPVAVPPELRFNELAGTTPVPFWLELVNSAADAQSLAGWVIARDGDLHSEYVFPSGRSLAAGGYLAVTQVELGFIPKVGDRLFLYPPGRGSIQDAVVMKKNARARFPQATGPWLTPSQLTPGAANAFTFHDEVVINEIMYHPHSFPAVPATFGASNYLVTITNTWKYEQSGTDLGVNWRVPGYDDGAWPSGDALLYVTTSTLPAPKKTLLSMTNVAGARIVTWYFRTEFLFDGNTNNLVTMLHPIIDDGAVFYLNGEEVFRYNLPPAPAAIAYSTVSLAAIATANYTGPFVLPNSALRLGTNVLAVEVHKASGTDSDVVFGLELFTAVQLTPALAYRESSESWAELYNRSSNAVNLTGWRFGGGIDYRFSAGKILAPGGYLVVSKDVASLLALHPGIDVVGPFDKSLSHHNDDLVLKDPNGNPADEVHYYDSAPWPGYVDGGGSSLELRDPHADNSKAEAWAASDESGQSSWATYTYRGVAATERAASPSQWHEFVLGLLSEGEALLDDISVIEAPDGAAPKQLLQNGSFESGMTSWRFLGTHRHSEVIVDPDNPGNHVLHLVATGPTEHMHNHLETTFVGNASVANGKVYEISFRAKWRAGSSQLNTRLYFNRLAKVTTLAFPTASGTPGRRNSRFEANIGPTFTGFRHSPIVPEPNTSVAVSVTAQDADGVSGCTVFWNVNGGAWSSAPMNAKGNGLYTASLPGWPAGTLVQFYVSATDGLGASSFFPAKGPGSRALYKVNDNLATPGRLHNLRLLMLPADAALLHAPTNVMSNDSMPATVVYDEQQTFYDVSLHLQGSERGRGDSGRVGFTLEFHGDDLFRGVHATFTVDRSGGYSGRGGRHDEIVLKHAINHAGGLPGMYDDLVRIFTPRNAENSTGLLILAKYGDEFLDTQYANGGDGNLFKIELIYSPSTTVNGNVQGAKVPQPDDVVGTDFQDLGDDKESYRWNFLNENNHVRDDYSQLIALAKSHSLSGAALDARSRQVMDINEWMRAFAFESLAGVRDTYTYDNLHNFVVYFPPGDPKALAFLWDMDFGFVGATGDPLFGSAANLQKINQLPANLRLFQWHLLDLINSTYNTAYLSRWTSHYGKLLGQDWSGINTYVSQRVTSVNAQVAKPIPFAITNNNGQDFLVTTPAVLIGGNSWLNIQQITLAGSSTPLPFTWASATRWLTTVPLILGTNLLTFQAYDYQSNLVASKSITVTSTSATGGLDSDGDGMPDAWETAHGLNPKRADANEDSDQDGVSNLQEFLSGTDPQDKLSYLKIGAAGPNEGNVRLTLPAVAGRSYSVQYRDLTPSSLWQKLPPDLAARTTNWVAEVLDPVGASQKRFYRLVTPLQP